MNQDKKRTYVPALYKSATEPHMFFLSKGSIVIIKIRKQSGFLQLLFLINIIVIMSMLHGELHAQDQEQNDQAEITTEETDEPHLLHPGYRHLIAFGKVNIINILFWAKDRYLLNADWSYFNASTIKRGFLNGFSWDSGNWRQNVISRFFAGNMYFNMSRVTDLSFWEACVYPYVGTLIFEYIYDAEDPSYNDMIFTPMNGIVFGEITNRIATELIDNSATGAERVFRELGAAIICAAIGLNRFFRAETWTVIEGDKKLNYNIRFQIATGASYCNINSYQSDSRNIFALAFTSTVFYDQRLTGKVLEDPFDFFIVDLKLNWEFPFENLMFQAEITALLLPFNKPSPHNLHIFGLFAGFEFYQGKASEKYFSQKIGMGDYSTFYINEEKQLYFTLGCIGYIGPGAAASLTEMEYSSDIYDEYNEPLQFNQDSYPYYIGMNIILDLILEMGIKDKFKFYASSTYHYLNSFHHTETSEQMVNINCGTQINLFFSDFIRLEYVAYIRLSAFHSYHSSQKSNMLLLTYGYYL